jgi:molybdate/tungstate transport system substrate-binding protein
MVTNLVRETLAPAAARRDQIAVASTKGNSVALANQIKAGSQRGDVFMSAGASVNDTLMGAANGSWVDWYAVFAHNAVVLAYSPRSRFASEFEAARGGHVPWYQVLTTPGVKLGRDDPDLDPLGYYDLFVASLAERYYGLPGLRERILGADRNPAQVLNTSAGLLTSGNLDAQFMYASGAADAGVPYIGLPGEVNLSNPSLRDTYATVSYTTAKGQTFPGSTIDVTATILNRAPGRDAAVRLLALLLSADGRQMVAQRHLIPAPVLVGGNRAAVPAALRPYLQGTYPP